MAQLAQEGDGARQRLLGGALQGRGSCGVNEQAGSAQTRCGNWRVARNYWMVGLDASIRVRRLLRSSHSTGPQ